MKRLKLFENFENLTDLPEKDSPSEYEYPKDLRWDEVLKRVIQNDDVKTLQQFTAKFMGLTRGVKESQIIQVALRVAVKSSSINCLKWMFSNPNVKRLISMFDRIYIVVAWALENNVSEEILQLLADNIDLHYETTARANKPTTGFELAKRWIESNPNTTRKQEALSKLEELFG
jgi:hypothetical protein